ncbi:hypothetical protein L1887_42157 [Cichorium endivia]|nr:hypothetical protein L1887_42157 [Cichorium endivia]
MLPLFTLVLLTFSFAISMTSLGEGNVVSANPTPINNTIAKPGCLTHCGNVTVKYPFGIGEGCYLDDDGAFEVTCNSTFDPAKLFIGSSDIEIHSISDSEMRISNTIASVCYDEYGVANIPDVWLRLKEGYRTFSQKNKFTVIGCDDLVLMNGDVNGVKFTSGCSGFCSNASDVSNGECSGIGCCQTSIPKGLRYISASFKSFGNHTSVMSFNRCSFAFLAESFHFGGLNDLSDDYFDIRTEPIVPIVVDWVVGGTQSCSQATACKGNSVCMDVDTGGYRCSCKEGYEGNPYLDSGCQDIDECERKFPCYHGVCTNTPGSYDCPCPTGYNGTDGKTENGCVPVAKDSKAPDVALAKDSKDSKFPDVLISLVVVFGFLAISSALTGICFVIRKRKLIKLREKFFEQNGGVFLRQKLKAPGATDAVTTFSSEQLRKATDNYSEEKIVGKEVAMELEGLRKVTTHPWVQHQEIPDESESLILEVEQSDLYGVPLIPYSSNEWESYSGSTGIAD